MARRLAVGVVGYGFRGRMLLYLADKHRLGLRVVEVADTDPYRLQQAGSDSWLDGRVGVSDDVEKVIGGDAEVVLIATPEYVHAEAAVAALRAGKTVFLEKPLATTVEDCDAILRAVRETDGKLYIGHNMRHWAPFQAAQSAVSAGRIGEPLWVSWPHTVSYGGDAYFRDWHAERRNVGSLLLQKGAHDLDIIQWMLGAWPASAMAMGSLTVYDRAAMRGRDERLYAEEHWKSEHYPPLTQSGFNPDMDVEDMSHMVVEFRSGAMAYYGQCHFSPQHRRGGIVVGTEGSIDWLDGGYRIFTERDKPGRPLEYRRQSGEGHGGMDEDMLSEFAAFARGRAEPTTSLVSARYAVAAGLAATQSMRSEPRCEVSIPPLAPDLEAALA